MDKPRFDTSILKTIDALHASEVVQHIKLMPTFEYEFSAPKEKSCILKSYQRQSHASVNYDKNTFIRSHLDRILGDQRSHIKNDKSLELQDILNESDLENMENQKFHNNRTHVDASLKQTLRIIDSLEKPEDLAFNLRTDNVIHVPSKDPYKWLEILTLSWFHKFMSQVD